jgi:hypothetical protein
MDWRGGPKTALRLSFDQDSAIFWTREISRRFLQRERFIQQQSLELQQEADNNKTMTGIIPNNAQLAVTFCAS